MSTLLQLRKDPERLHQAAQILERENETLIKKVLTLQARIDTLEGRDPASLQLQIEALEQQLAVRNQSLFGDKSEKGHRAQRRAADKKPLDISRRATKDLRKVPRYVAEHLLAWVDAVGHEGLEHVRKVPGYHDEPLKGPRKGQRSFRLTKA